jgi:hypothetical protein
MPDANEAAKRVLIAYQQLGEVVKEHLHFGNAPAYLASYNRILDTLKECFSLDPDFQSAIQHLAHLRNGDNDKLPNQMECDAKILRATAHSFIELYLSPEEKKKTIGFHG